MSNPFLGCIHSGSCNCELCCMHQHLPQGFFSPCVWFSVQTAAYAQECIPGNVWCVNFIFLQCFYEPVWFISHLLSNCLIFYTMPTQDTSTVGYWCQKWQQKFAENLSRNRKFISFSPGWLHSAKWNQSLKRICLLFSLLVVSLEYETLMLRMNKTK